MIYYALLISATLADGGLMGYLSILTGINKHWLPFIGLIFINIVPIWSTISKYAKPKNLVFDELLFYTLLTASYLASVMLIDNRNSFTWINCLGLTIAFIGFVLLKIGSAENVENQIAQ